MATKTITLTISGDSLAVDSSIDNYARSQGWQDMIFDAHGNSVQNQESQTEFARRALSTYLRAQIRKYVVRTQKEQMEQSIDATLNTALDAVQLSISE